MYLSDEKTTKFHSDRVLMESHPDDMKHWSFKVCDDGHDKPIIEVQYKGETKRFTPEEISSMVLTKMKRQQSHLLERQYPMQLLHVQHISMNHKDKPQKMQVQLPD